MNSVIATEPNPQDEDFNSLPHTHAFLEPTALSNDWDSSSLSGLPRWSQSVDFMSSFETPTATASSVGSELGSNFDAINVGDPCSLTFPWPHEPLAIGF